MQPQAQSFEDAQLSLEITRRLSLKDQYHSQAKSVPCPREHFDVALHPRLLCEEHHDAGVDDEGLGVLPDSRLHDGRLASTSSSHSQQQIVLRWRQKEKLKTTAVALVLCLNIGVDPPDVIKISPCARLECWVDPMSNQPAKALETIGKNLQAQYERWQPKAKYKTHLDPTVDDVKKLAQSCRRNAKSERVLFHYNGHGVPRPTANGEIWVFNSRYTQYIPLSVYELQAWLGAPCIYVLDCSSAGVIINAFKAFMDSKAYQGQLYAGTVGAGLGPTDPMREIIVLAACAAHEVLPQNPELPADVFTACLTTPIKVALRWFCSRSLLRHDGITKDLIDQIPGRQTDRKTPLGELNWIFTAITDTIAWNVLPKPLFQKLFRSDLLVASLFRNFLLAERIMTATNCTPVSYPRLPPTHNHPMWQAWDMAAEMCLMQLPHLLANPTAEFKPSSFFSEQLTAFDLWLAHGAQDKKPPEQLPIVLQVLLSQVHRLRALVLLGRFLDMGPWAVDLALSVGIFPYVLKLLQTISLDLRPTLVFIWCKILALDLSCQADLVKDNGHTYFIKYLDSLVVVDGAADLNSRAQAAFVLAAVCDSHPKGQALCASGNLLATLLKWLRFMFPPQEPFQTPGHALLLKWLCLCLGKLCQDAPEVSLLAIREGAADLLVQLLTMASPVIRAAAVFGLGCLVHSLPSVLLQTEEMRAPDGSLIPPQVLPTCNEDRLPAEQLIGNAVKQVVYDPSVLVRCELAVLYARFVRGHAPRMQDALVTQQQRLADYARQHAAAPRPGSPLSASAPHLSPGHAAVGGHAHSYSTMEGTQRGSMELGMDSRRNASARGATTPGLRASGMGASPPSPPTEHLGETSPKAATMAGSDEAAVAEEAATAHAMSGTEGMSAPQQQALATYSALLESIQMLALDPAPKVAKLGRQVLRIAGCDLQFIDVHTPGQSSANMHTNSNVALKQKVLHPRTWARPPSSTSSEHHTVGGMAAPSASVHGGGVSMMSTPSSSCPPSPTRSSVHNTFSRHPYVLKPLGAPGPNRDPRGFTAQPPQPPPPQSVTLPQSLIYKMSSEAFSRPLLEPMASAWRDTEGCNTTSWTSPVDPGRRAFRVREIENAMARSRHITSPKLREQVYSVETDSVDGTTALAFHPYHPLLICADTRGYIKVSNFQDSTLANAFHVTSGTSIVDPRQMPSQVTFLQQLNEADGPMLLTGCTDGTVRVWRNYTLPGCQRMATAMQSATIHLPPQTGKAATYAWAPARSQLYAAGGCHPDMVYCWDLAQEVCSSLIRVSSSSSLPVSVDRILLGAYSAGSSASCMHPALLMAACSDASLRLYDVRTSTAGPALVLQPFRNPPAGVAVEPAGKPSIVAAVSERGEMRMMDLRMVPHVQAAGAGGAEAGSVQGLNAYDSAAAATVKSVPAHSKGGVSAMVAHAHAPLMATGTKGQVVKVWTDECDVVGAIRPQSNFLSQEAGPVTCMAWHPYQPLLAAGCGDSIATVYAIDQNVGPGTYGLKQMQAQASGAKESLSRTSWS